MYINECYQRFCGSYTDLRAEVLGYAHQEIGRPFLDHYPDGYQCEDDTQPECMLSGMDPRGYDCMGLIIGSLCLATYIRTRQWPADYRHCGQLQKFAVERAPSIGDIVLVNSTSLSGRQYPQHMGLHVGASMLLHTVGARKRVVVGEPLGIVESTQTIDMNALYEAVRDELSRDDGQLLD